MNLTESLADWRNRNRSLLARLETAVDGLDEATLNQTPDAGIWSPAQVLEHLVLTNTPYLATMEYGLSRAPRATDDVPIRFSFFGNLIRKGAGPTGNVPAPAELHPRTSTIAFSIVGDWTEQQRSFIDLIARAEGHDLSRTRVRNPLFAFIPLNLADCFEILTTHTDRHVGQIEQRRATLKSRE